jgi:hypothetical protein
MFTLKHFNQASYYDWSTIHKRTFATLEAALADAKRTIDLDIETECPSCDEIHVINDEGEIVNRWLWCPDDIGAPFSWHES